jgi:hypothetical protein
MTTIMSGYDQTKTLEDVATTQADERLDDIRKLLDVENNDDAEGEILTVEEIETIENEIGKLYEYGLWFGPFSYYKYEISWGGPSETVLWKIDNDHNHDKYGRCINPNWTCEFVYKEWFKSHTITLTGDQHDTAVEWLYAFIDCGQGGWGTHLNHDR